MDELEMSAADLVRFLGLARHPEGGFYAETFRSSLNVASAEHPGQRSAGTAIYYLLERGGFSALHRVRSDEVWHHYFGAAVELHVLDETGAWTTRTLGSRIALGEQPQLVVAGGTWQAAAVPSGEAADFALCGCTVAPGFEFSDFELGDRDALIRRFPEHAERIVALTR